jgi:hypothetical protein
MNTITFVIAIAVLIIAAIAFFMLVGKRSPVVTNFDECAAAGYPIMESYPEQCSTPDGRTFIRELPTGGPEETSENTGNIGEGLGLQANGCAVAGCSGQLCVSADEAGELVTTCEYRAEYGCYKEASCEPQQDGKCGWTQTTALLACLRNPPPIDAGTEMPQ